MINSLKRAALLALTWAVAWAPVAVLIGVTIVDPDNSMDEMWVAVGAYPGFLCGALFSVLLGIAERRHRLADVMVSRAALWGGLSGVLVGTLPALLAEPRWLVGTGILGMVTLMSALSAIVSVLVARKLAATATRPA